MTDPLEGRIVAVTGAARGIGRAIAEALADRGALVAGLDPELPLDPNGSGIRWIQCDVTDEASVKTALSELVSQTGYLDALVNNAGILVEKPIEETTLDDFDRVMAVNLRGVFLTGKLALPYLRISATEGRQPTILNIASELAHLGRPEYTAYCASKGGVISLTRSMARELAPDITVNALAPGPTDTDMLKSEKNYAAWSGTGEGIPMGRVGTVDDISKVACFLLGNEAGFMTGSIVDVNGGAAMY